MIFIGVVLYTRDVMIDLTVTIELTKMNVQIHPTKLIRLFFNILLVFSSFFH